ncbi:hypothetical protein LTR17_020910 [Elasticomyces elasticus]|nr:hypothetical protein LTR17_020910 [Elasticomyces elasticus]
MSTEYEEEVSKRTQVYRELGQGLKILHDPSRADIERTKSTNAAGDANLSPSAATVPDAPRTFNWLEDADGLHSLFPTARIMLYDYASAWTGKRKVRATMRSICTWLLDDLTERRKNGTEVTRPLIMIGHSMGGVVIAKTLCVARARREYEAVVTCTMGCLFFGAPFKGSEMAKVALLYSSVFGSDAYESLLSFMRTEKNDTLDEVTNDFMEISGKLAPPIELICVYEQVPTDVDYAERFMGSPKMNGLLQHKFFRPGAKKILEVGVSMLPGTVSITASAPNTII